MKRKPKKRIITMKMFLAQLIGGRPKDIKVEKIKQEGRDDKTTGTV